MPPRETRSPGHPWCAADSRENAVGVPGSSSADGSPPGVSARGRLGTENPTAISAAINSASTPKAI